MQMPRERTHFSVVVLSFFGKKTLWISCVDLEQEVSKAGVKQSGKCRPR
jgi:hypothetical protein